MEQPDAALADFVSQNIGKDSSVRVSGDHSNALLLNWLLYLVSRA